jgi:putative flippase GtrA
MGLILDLAIFSSLIYLGLSIFISNIIAGSFAVTFVYFSSARYTFFHKSKFLLIKFVYYVFFNISRIYILSITIVFLTEFLHVIPLLPKILVIPVSLYMNFLFMNVLMTNKIKFY